LVSPMGVLSVTNGALNLQRPPSSAKARAYCINARARASACEGRRSFDAFYKRPARNRASDGLLIAQRRSTFTRARTYSDESREQSWLVNATDIAIMKYYNDTPRVLNANKKPLLLLPPLPPPSLSHFAGRERSLALFRAMPPTFSGGVSKRSSMAT